MRITFYDEYKGYLAEIAEQNGITVTQAAKLIIDQHKASKTRANTYANNSQFEEKRTNDTLLETTQNTSKRVTSKMD